MDDASDKGVLPDDRLDGLSSAVPQHPVRWSDITLDIWREARLLPRHIVHGASPPRGGRWRFFKSLSGEIQHRSEGRGGAGR